MTLRVSGVWLVRASGAKAHSLRSFKHLQLLSCPAGFSRLTGSFAAWDSDPPRPAALAAGSDRMTLRVSGVWLVRASGAKTHSLRSYKHLQLLSCSAGFSRLTGSFEHPNYGGFGHPKHEGFECHAPYPTLDLLGIPRQALPKYRNSMADRTPAPN